MTTPPTASLGNGQLPPPGQVKPAQPAAAPTPAPAPAPVSATTPPPANAPAQHIAAHDTMLGRAFKILSGHTTQYHVDPTTGQTVATPVQNKPGQFWRNIVAGALLGGAAGGEAGAKDEGSPLEGAAAGGTAVINRNQMLDKERFQRAQQEYANELRANQEQRAQKEFQNEQTLFKAQIAMNNLQRLHMHYLLAGDDFKTHEEEAQAGKAQASIYSAAGVKPTQTLLESQVPEFTKNHQGSATKFDFITTGTRVTGFDPKTHLPTYESVISLYPRSQNPNLKTYPVTQAFLNHLNKDKMPLYHPDLVNGLKVHQLISGTQMAAIMSADMKTRTQTAQERKIQTGVQANEAKIAAYKAEAARAEAAIRNGNAALSMTKQQASDLQGAFKKLDASKGDINALDPSQKLIIGNYLKSQIPALAAEIKAESSANPDQMTPKLHELMSRLDTITSLTQSALTPAAAPTPGAPTPGQPASQDALINSAVEKLSAMPYGDAMNYVNSSKQLSPQVKKEIQQRLEQSAKQKSSQNRQIVKGVIENTLGLPPTL